MSYFSGQKPKTALGYHRLLSPSASLKVSPICLGTMNFGDSWKELMGECSKDTAFSIMDTFYAAGGNFIDTANMYMLGQTEEWLGEWMAERGVRDQLVVATKYSQPLKLPMTEPEGTILSNYGGNNKKSLRLSLEESLRRLRTKYVDILYVHAWEGTTSISELMRALDDVVRTGQVLYLGVSNWPAWVVTKANAYARMHGLTPFVVYEGRWNAAEREIERDILPMCRDEGMGITVWSALGGGKFKTGAQREEPGGRTFAGERLGTASDDKFENAFCALEKIATRRGISPSSVAFRYVMLKAPYVFPILGGRKVEYLRTSIDALDVDLSEEDMQEIESAVPFDLGYPHSLLSGNPSKQISAEHPATFVSVGCAFVGVGEPKAIGLGR
ncbi:NADP-dependent oxidoreductase domain-containing protein [Xylogone sp. PMI_703]|nr:NADP-dependent oxidoreductase domain-containing protein [Xylogone sp. PMI_703]